jgi:hypothetical protein
VALRAGFGVSVIARTHNMQFVMIKTGGKMINGG